MPMTQMTLTRWILDAQDFDASDANDVHFKAAFGDLQPQAKFSMRRVTNGRRRRDLAGTESHARQGRGGGGA